MIVVDDDVSLDISSAITIEATVYPEALTATNGDYRAIVTKRGGNYANYALRLNGNKVEFYYNGPSATGVVTDWNVWQGATTLASDAWYDISVVFTYVGGPIEVRVDGGLIGGSWIAGVITDPVTTNDYELRIGSAYTGYPQYFNGLIADVKIWSVALTYNELGDNDDDGVLNSTDKCAWTTLDSFDGWNQSEGRYKWDGGEWISAGKGAKGFEPDMDYTYGCSGEQILDAMVIATGLPFDGHYKYGVSKSILEDWNRGTYYIGPTLLETVNVPANDADGVASSTVLDVDKDYFLKAYGTATACWQPGCYITFDAEYSTSDGVTPWSTWADGVAAPYDSYGADLLDLKVNGTFVDWGAYNPLHSYEIPYAGTGNALFLVYDLAGSYFNDVGSLFVDIIEDKWVDLW